MASLQQLSGTDVAFLALENASLPMSVLGVLVLDPNVPGGDYSYDRLRRTIAERVHLLPPFTRRLVGVPWGLDRPYWLPVEDLDLDAHVRRVTAPAPGDMAALATVVGDVASQLLPRDRPMWELLIVEGLEDGRVGVVARIHHASLYGATGVEFIAQLLDFDPVGREVEPPGDEPAPEPPGTSELLGRAALHTARLPVTFGRFVGRTAKTIGSSATTLGRRIVTGGDVGMSRPRRTPLNGALTPRREVAFTRVPLDDLKVVKDHLGGTVNDVVLAATTLALREYFLDHDGLPVNPPTASCPVSGGGSDISGADRLSAMLIGLPIALDDPVEILQTITASTTGAKDFTDAVGVDTVAGLADAMPPPVLTAGTSVYNTLRLARLHPPMCSLVVSNMVGPPVPLYFAGARIDAIFPLGPLLPDVGLNVTVLSDMGTLDVGLIACPDVVPDVDAIAAGFASGVATLLEHSRQVQAQP